MNALTITGASQVTVTPNPEVIAFRDSQLVATRAITSITTPAVYSTVGMMVRNLKQLGREIENARKEVKAEPLKITKLIDQIASEASAPIEVEVARLEKLANDYAREQARIQAEAEQRARQEREAAAALIAKEQAEAQRKIREEHEAKLKAEAEEKARIAAASEKPVVVDAFAAVKAEIKAEQDLAARQAEVDRIAAEKAAEVASRIVVAPPSIAAKTVWRWIVQDVVALAKSRPDLVTITPKTREINALVNGGERTIAGLSITQEVEAKL